MWSKECLSFLSQQSTSSINQQMCQSILLDSIQKGTHFSFLSQQWTSNVNLQLCQLTLSWLNNMKKASSSFLSLQSTSNVNQQLCQLTSSWLDTKGAFSPSSDNDQSVMSINNCVYQPCLNSIQRAQLSPSPCNNVQTLQDTGHA